MNRRERAIERLGAERFDVVIVGGGINGAMCALALASHGVCVGLVERDDFASGTSQESSNLIWGGFKYLEGYEVRLVADLCASRNRLARAFPTRLNETRVVATLDHSSPYSPAFATLGAMAYWGLGRFHTRRPRHRSASAIHRLEPAVDVSDVRGGIEYSDYVLVDNDARFVSELVVDAARRGAAVANYIELAAAEYSAGEWRLSVGDSRTGQAFEIAASVLVNAAGPLAEVVGARIASSTEHHTVFSKGVHLVVPRITGSRRMLAFYDDWKRLFYVIPMGHRSCIGTTDTPTDDPAEVVTDADRNAVLEQINKRLGAEQRLSVDDVIAERCGVRALVLRPGEQTAGRDWTELSRRHVVEVDEVQRVVTVLGGKLSDCLNVGDEVVDAVRSLGLGAAHDAGDWYGEPPLSARDDFLRRAAVAGLDRPCEVDAAPSFGALLWRRYGRRAAEILEVVRAEPELGDPIMELDDYCAAELRIAARDEWIVTLDDFVRRRSMLAQLNRPKDLCADPGLALAAEILLGPAGLAELQRLHA